MNSRGENWPVSGGQGIFLMKVGGFDNQDTMFGVIDPKVMQAGNIELPR